MFRVTALTALVSRSSFAHLRRTISSAKVKINLLQTGSGQSIPGVEKAPVIIASKLLPRLKACHLKEVTTETFDFHEVTQHGSALEGCGLESKIVCETVKKAYSEYDMIINIGGDHSVGTGTMIGSSEGAKNVGRRSHSIWFGALPDLNTPRTSTTGNVNGMTAGLALGLESVTEYDWSKGRTLSPDQITFLGLRDFSLLDPGEKDYIQRFNFPYYLRNVPINTINNRLAKAVREVDLHISFDIDAFDPEIAPSVGTIVPNGYSMEEISSFFRNIRKPIKVFDLVEVNPSIGSPEDVEKTADVAFNVILMAFGTHAQIR